MKFHEFQLDSSTHHPITIYHWRPEQEEQAPRGVIQIAHGMTESGKRYERFAKALVEEGYYVYANDHRGHGRSASSQEKLGHLDRNDGRHMVEDMKLLSTYIQEQHSGVPFILFGHSMGSFLSQMYIALYGSILDGVVLCGSNGPRGPELHAGKWASDLITKWKGIEHRSQFIDSLAFGSFNKKFKPSKTKYDWLSRDADEVQKYIDDPFCGYICTVGFYYELFHLLQQIHRPEITARIPKDLPVLIIAGDKDPVGNFGAGVRKLEQLYTEQLKLKDVKTIIYPGARHELLNETNRDEITSDCIAWFNELVSSKAIS